MLSIIITSYKEEHTIGKALECILNKEYSGLPDVFEIITVIPDNPTYLAAKETIAKFKVKNWIHLQDQLKGKPTALSMAIQKAKGDYFLFTDGDVYLGKNAISKIYNKIISDSNIGGISGRPVCTNNKNNFWGYCGNLLADTIHNERVISNNKKQVYPMSGYLFITQKFNWKLPPDVLDDAYITYRIHQDAKIIAYEPDAKVFVKYPTTISDYFKQKVRNYVGFKKIETQLGLLPQDKRRSLRGDLKNSLKPILYAQNLQDLWYSLFMYPLRVVIWVRIYYHLVIKKTSLGKVWQRVESTK
jgi:cellulose synthase/poly-beta-1,6-N-acetylglucosamine synthase-like glycosyltransferase